jgi:hypothetical protein
MGGLLLFVFVAFVLLGVWRIVVAQAQAEAKALEVQKQQITPELMQLRTIEMMQQHWDGHLPEVYMGGQGGGALPMIDVLKAAGRTK